MSRRAVKEFRKLNICVPADYEGTPSDRMDELNAAWRAMSAQEQQAERRRMMRRGGSRLVREGKA